MSTQALGTNRDPRDRGTMGSRTLTRLHSSSQPGHSPRPVGAGLHGAPVRESCNGFLFSRGGILKTNFVGSQMCHVSIVNQSSCAVLCLQERKGLASVCLPWRG